MLSLLAIYVYIDYTFTFTFSISGKLAISRGSRAEISKSFLFLRQLQDGKDA